MLVINVFNPITEKYTETNVQYPKIEYVDYCRLKKCNNDNELINELNSLLHFLNATIIYDCGRKIIVNCDLYKSYLSEYYYYMLKLKNQIMYNIYLDKLINRHTENILFELTYQEPTKTKIKKQKLQNKFIKQQTKDLFTGEIIYQYVNLKTNEIINSKNPNLLEELNFKKPKTKVKNKKELIGKLSFSNITFKIQ